MLKVFQSIRPQLFKVVGTITQPKDVEDIVQEAFLRSYQADKKQQIQHPKTYLFRTAKNLALNYIKLSDIKLVDSLEDSGVSDVYSDGPSVEAQVESKDRFLLFCRAVRNLPLQCRRAFILKKVYGLSQKEIAQYLGVSEGTVEKHVAKGLVRCDEYLTEHGVLSTSQEKRKVKRK
ncbi:MAG: RNA polymerase sigma factor [Pseudomonadota bacterium]